jgi:hypothetical protein
MLFKRFLVRNPANPNCALNGTTCKVESCRIGPGESPPQPLRGGILVGFRIFLINNPFWVIEFDN